MNDDTLFQRVARSRRYWPRPTWRVVLDRVGSFFAMLIFILGIFGFALAIVLV